MHVSRMNSKLEFRPLSKQLGAEVIGLDIASDYDEATKQALRDAFDEYRLFLVRGQAISAEDQTRFAEVFGTITLREKRTRGNAQGNVQHVSNARDDGIFGVGELDFHCDQLFHDPPLKALILYAIELASSGGDTRFCNTSAVYESMPDALKKQIEGRRCRHERNYSQERARAWNVAAADEDAPSAVHPIVWTEARTGRKALWVNPGTTMGIIGEDAAASKAVLEKVRACIQGDPDAYTHRWQIDDLVLWDNRVLMHARTPFDTSEPRTLRRTPIM